MEYGYVRLSTREQNEQRQLIALREFGIGDRQVYMDKQSGKDFDRPQYKRLVRRLKNGDTLVNKSIDRLAHNYDEILEQWRLITKEKQAGVVVQLARDWLASQTIKTSLFCRNYYTISFPFCKLFGGK